MQTFRVALVFLAAALLIVRPLAIEVDPAYGQTENKRLNTYYGPKQNVGNGVAYSRMTMDKEGKPVEIGFDFTAAALTGLPSTTHNTEYVLALPQQAEVTPFTHLGLNWNPTGHIPPGVYDVPHFDFHFYVISPDLRSGITTTGSGLALIQKKPQPEHLPSNYIYAPGGEEPKMGAHWIDPASHEFHGKSFTTTFIYGTYYGSLAFLEPMMTLAYLQKEPNFVQNISLPEKYAVRGYYPTSYGIRYDPTSLVYSVYLSGFQLRQE